MINRDVDFWDGVAQHPEVAPHIFMGQPIVSLAPLIEDKRNLPYASANGGCIFVKMDHLGLLVEMHTLYRPEGWGREVAINGKRFIHDVMKTAALITTHEQEGNWRSSPPKSHGWKPITGYCSVGLQNRLRLWMLTREAWLASPVGRKM